MSQKHPVLTGVAILGGILLLFLAAVVAVTYTGPRAGPLAFRPGTVAVLPITGVIVDSTDTVRQLKQFVEDEGVRAVVLRINSPGGAVAPAQEIYDEVRRVRSKHVVASMGTVAASGGYYVALGAEKIYANPGTITGSIGVIMQFSSVEELLRKIGLQPHAVTSGPHKDTGSPFRPMTEADRALLQGVVDDVYGQFVDAVRTRRNLTPEQLRAVADGRILSGSQAKALHLVDELGSLQEAIRAAARLAGIPGEPEVIYPRRRFSLLEFLLGLSPTDIVARLTGGGAVVQYLLHLPGTTP